MDEFDVEYKNLDFFDEKFESFQHLKNELDKWCDLNYVPIKTRTSNRLKLDDEVSKLLIYSSVYFTCVHYGEHRARVTTGTRVHQKVYATNCPFKIHIKADILNRNMYVCNYELKHNHLIGPEIFCSYPKNRRLDDNEQKEVEKLLAVDPVHRKLKRHITVSTNKAITSYDIYNLKAKIVNKQNNYVNDEGKKIKNLIEKLKNEDIDNQVVFCLDEDSQLKCLYIQTNFQADWFKNYDTIVHIDGTFKLNVENYLLYVLLVQDSNCHGRPVAYCLMKNETNENLEFFYKTFVEYNNVEFVKLVMVDKDLSNLYLIPNFFPNSVTLLCVFHVVKYLKSVVGKLVASQCLKNDFMESIHGMIYALNEQEYNDNYTELRELAKKFKDFLSYFEKNWHSCQKLWVRYFRQKLPTLGTHTNNHLESYNNNIIISIKPQSHLTECIVELMTITKEFLHKDIQNNLNQIKTRVSRTSSSSIVNELISKLEDTAADLILKQYDLMRKKSYNYKRSGENDFKIESDSEVYHVQVDLDNLVKCECDFTLNYMLPCRHSLFICEFNILLKPWFHKRYLKLSRSSEINPLNESQSIVSSQKPLWDWTKDCIRPSTPEQKFRKLKNIFEDLTNVMCASGESEFNDQQMKLENFLHSLQNNTLREESGHSLCNQSTPSSSQMFNYMLKESPHRNISISNSVILKKKDFLESKDITLSFNDETIDLIDQTDFDLSPEIKVNKVVNRVGRPKNWVCLI